MNNKAKNEDNYVSLLFITNLTNIQGIFFQETNVVLKITTGPFCDV